MNKHISINIGDRFDYKDQFFEICYCESNVIRYAETKGGKMHYIDKKIFIEKILSGEINYNEIITRKTNKKFSATIEEINIYINYVLKNNIKISHKNLRYAIDEILQIHPNIKQISSSTLARYLKKFRDNLNSLNSFYGKLKGNRYLRFSLQSENIINEEINKFIHKKEDYTAQDIHDSIRYRIELEDKDAKVPSVRTIYRKLKKIDAYNLIKLKKSKATADKKFKAAGLENTSPNILAIIEIDTHYVDCLIVDEYGYILGRPLICVAIDIYSRAIVGWHLCMLAPCATKTLLALKNMLTRPTKDLFGGIPSIIIPDNGVEFRNHAVERLCDNLTITLIHSKPNTPNNKPHIERFFETFNTLFIHKLQGTTFSNPVKRYDYDSENLACLTLDNLRELTHEWIENIYHYSINSSLQQRPINIWNNSKKLFHPMHLTQYEANIICRTVKKGKINQGRISFLGLHYYSHALKSLEYSFNEKVNYYVDETDLSSIYVQDPSDKNNFIIADSTNPQLTKNLTLIELVESRKILRNEYKISPLQIEQDKYLHLARLRLIEKVQELAKVQRKLRQVKNDLPKMIKELEQELNIKKESSTNTDNSSLYPNSFNSINEVKASTNSEYEFLVEEINLDD